MRFKMVSEKTKSVVHTRPARIIARKLTSRFLAAHLYPPGSVLAFLDERLDDSIAMSGGSFKTNILKEERRFRIDSEGIRHNCIFLKLESQI